MFLLSEVWIWYPAHQLNLKLKYPLKSHLTWIHLAPVLIHCLWGLQLTDVWRCSFSPAWAAIIQMWVWHWAPRAGKRQTDRLHYSCTYVACRALQLDGSLEGCCQLQVHFLSWSSFCDSVDTILNKFFSEEETWLMLNFFMAADMLRSPDPQQDLCNGAHVSEHPKIYSMVNFPDIF